MAIDRSGRRRSFARTLLAGVVTVFVLTGAVGTPETAPPSAPQAVRPALANPEIDEACGIDVTLVLDASGSIEQYRAVEDVRNAAKAFLIALANTNSRARVIDFGSNSRETAPMTVVDTASVSTTGVHGEAVAAYYNPQPPFPTGVTGRAWNGRGSVNNRDNFSNTTSRIYTNWDAALDQTADAPPELVVFMTDGDPNGVVDDHAGDPFFQAGDMSPDVRLGISGTNDADDLSLDRAVEEANRAKQAGARMLAVGVGGAFSPTNTDSIDRLKAVTNGPASTVVTNPALITDLNDVDVALVADFAQLSNALRRIVTELCSPSLTVRKLAQSPDDASYQPAEGWQIEVEPTVATAQDPPYRWILPTSGAAVGPQIDETDANGFAQFQWEPDPPTRDTIATVTETEQDDYIPRDWACEAKNPNGSVVHSEGELGPGDTSFPVTVGPEQIVTCTIRNDFDYQPEAVVTKVNSPTIVRGDGAGTEVVSHYTATNTGNTPLSPVSAVDDECSPVVPIETDGVIEGDDGNRVVDPGETWELECVRQIQHGLTDDDVNIVNTVTMTGRAPNGEVLTRTATDDVDVLTPNIVIEKSVSPDSGLAPLDVTYTFEVHTDGNTPIGEVELSDDTAPCSNAANVDGPTGDDGPNPGFLDPGETWVYTCDADGLDTTVTDVATVVGQPVTPDDLDPIGATVTDDSSAVVEVFDPNLQLTKSVDRRIGFAGTLFTYTYTLTNTGSADLAPPDGRTHLDAVADDTCDDLVYQSGDTGDPDVLSPEEVWTYTCSRDYDDLGFKLNTAEAQMVVVGEGSEISVRARQLVLILAPAIRLVKRASATLVPSGTVVTYTYEVTNTGPTAIDDVEVTDVGPAACDPVYQSGDVGIQGRLGIGEQWIYTCTATLTKDEPTGEPTDVPNTATVTGTSVIPLSGLEGPPVTDSDTATVAVVVPRIELVKDVSAAEVRPGDVVTWTAVVTNTGDGPLYEVTITDDNCEPMVYQSGRADSDEVLDVGESWTYACSGAVPEDVTNIASVVAGDQFGTEVTDDDTQTVTVFTPAIDLVKTVDPELVPEGDTVDYTFEVTNIGTDQLSDVVLEDDKCEPEGPTGDTGGNGPDGLMDPGETWTYTCVMPISELTVNHAVVEGQDHLGGPVSAQDLATANAFRSGIAIVKTASPTVLVGSGDVTYEYVVTNTGNVPLADVKSRVVDDTCPDVQYVEGDIDENELLTGVDDMFETGPPEEWLFRCTTTISEDTTNTVVVHGTPVNPALEVPAIGPDVDATDDAFVEVLDPASITIVKQVTGVTDATFGFAGDLDGFELTTVGGTASQTFDGLGPGTYDVTETQLPEHWGLVGIVCDSETATVAGSTASIELAEGDAVTCTFTNQLTLPPDTSVLAMLFDLPGSLGGGPGPIALVVLIAAGVLGGAGFLAYQRRRRRVRPQES